MRRTLVVGASLAVLAAMLTQTVGPAYADTRRIQDPDDTDGPIDVETIVQGHYQEYVLYRVTAYDRWETSQLDDGSIDLSFDIDDDPAEDRRVVIEYEGGGGAQQRARIYDEDGSLIGKVVSRRPNRRSVEVWIKREQLDDPKRYRMHASVTTTSDPCPDECIDRTPDQGWLHHRLLPMCAHREATILGTRGNDELSGTIKADVIYARGGDDVITDIHHEDLVCGGRGDDSISDAWGWILLFGGPGADVLEGQGPKPEPCDDTASCAYPEALIFGGSGSDQIFGGSRHEHLLGGRGNDTIHGRGWSDRLEGGAGIDSLDGGGGADSCRTGETNISC